MVVSSLNINYDNGHFSLRLETDVSVFFFICVSFGGLLSTRPHLYKQCSFAAMSTDKGVAVRVATRTTRLRIILRSISRDKVRRLLGVAQCHATQPNGEVLCIYICLCSWFLFNFVCDSKGKTESDQGNGHKRSTLINYILNGRININVGTHDQPLPP